MDWQYLITTAIALAAAYIAWLARKDALKSIKTTNSLQERLEAYEHFPIVKISIENMENRIKFVLKNSSNKNPALYCEFKYILRIWAGNTFSVDKETTLNHDEMLLPLSTVEIFPEEINDLVSKSLPFLSQHPKEETNFVLRVKLKYSAAHPQSKPIYDETVAHFYYENDVLIEKS